MDLRESRGASSVTRYLFVLVPLMLLAIGVFTYQNLYRIDQQNQMYTQEAATAEASSVDELLTHLSDSILMYADTVSSVADLAKFEKNSPFQSLHLVNKDGVMCSTSHSKDVTESDVAKRGLQGKTGILVDFDAQVADETAIVFYAPVYSNGAIEGVVVGVMDQERLEGVLGTEVFGSPSATFLLTTEGRIIADSTDNREMVGKSLFSDYHKDDKLLSSTLDNISADRLTKKGLQTVLYNGGSFGYGYAHGGVNESAYVVNLSHSDYSVMKVFPSDVAAAMRLDTTKSTIFATSALLLLFAAYLVAVFVSHRRQQRRLREENERVSQVLEAFYGIYDRFCVIDLGTGAYQYLQFGEIEAFGIREAGSYDELRRQLSELIDHEAGDGDIWDRLDQSTLREALTVESPVARFEILMQLDTPKWESIAFIGLDYEGDQPRKAIFAVQDITDQHEDMVRMNHMLKEAVQDADAANSAKSEFLSRMSHDVRTPLNGILGMAGIARRNVDDRERVLDCLGKIDASGDFLLGLVNEILDISKIEAGKLVLDEEHVELTSLIREVQDMVTPAAAAKGQTVSFENRAQHQDVISDKVRLKNVVMNIVSNAMKYTPAGGHIWLTLSEQGQDAAGHAAYLLECRDDGIGMTEEFMKVVFEPFARAEDQAVQAEQGTGLGLPITRSMARLMGGDVTVTSEVGKGSTFHVHLSLRIAEQTSPKDEPQSGDIGELDLSGCRCLLVDDNELNREISAEILAMTGIQVDTAENGREAVAAYAEHPAGYYQAIFMDIQMPVMDGHDATRAIRASAKEDAGSVPIFAMTANAYADDVRAAKEAGMDEHLAKPIDLGRLYEVLATYVKGGRA